MAEQLRILFIPWDGAAGEHFVGRSERWKDVYDKKGKVDQYLRIVKYNGRKSPWISSAYGRDVQIYSRGHGAPGTAFVRSDHALAVDLQFDEVCDRLIATGLKKGFSGKIKLYS